MKKLSFVTVIFLLALVNIIKKQYQKRVLHIKLKINLINLFLSWVNSCSIFLCCPSKWSAAFLRACDFKVQGVGFPKDGLDLLIFVQTVIWFCFHKFIIKFLVQFVLDLPSKERYIVWCHSGICKKYNLMDKKPTDAFIGYPFFNKRSPYDERIAVMFFKKQNICLW